VYGLDGSKTDSGEKGAISNKGGGAKGAGFVPCVCVYDGYASPEEGYADGQKESRQRQPQKSSRMHELLFLLSSAM
jgi:hypothetical protein